MRFSSLILLSGLALVNPVNQPTYNNTASISESFNGSANSIVQVNHTTIPEANSQSNPNPHRGSGRRG